MSKPGIGDGIGAAILGDTPETDLDRGDDQLHRDIAGEQAYLDQLYGRLDTMRDQASRRLRAALRETGGTPQARSQRDITVSEYADKVTRLESVESGLCFGRLDCAGDERHYIGRIGMFDEDGDYEPLLLDWRAPAARPFYLATAAAPDGVRRRRHIRTKGRTVIDLDDEVLDLEQARASQHEDLAGEAALMAALDAGRTGRMRDIVETIQAEQDRIIRSAMEGVLVVQGGPGTGKTAVALHRAAYLLYTHRRRLSTQGVLIIGPNETFLRYISQVLPSLAETGVLLCTLGDLFPSVTARRVESQAVAEIKGRLAMADVIAEAVADRQVVPDEVMEVPFDGDVLVLRPEAIERARARARRSEKPHNEAREIFVSAVLDALVGCVADRIGTDPFADDPLGGNDAPGDPNLLGAADLADIRADVAADPRVAGAMEHLWPKLTPQRLLRDLFASAERLERAAGQLSAADRALLLRDRGPTSGPMAWSPADVALLDEAAELLGEDEESAKSLAQRLSEQRKAYAEGVLDIVIGSRSIDMEDDDDTEILMATDLLDADRLADRHRKDEYLTTAQRAAADRRWAFGHIIVDEAQELSAMAWRLLMRRCPSRSMTIVGDVAQTSDLAGTCSWADAMEPYVAQRWRREELSVGYRTPAEIMDVAGRLLPSIDATLRIPRAVREAGMAPWLLTSPVATLGDLVAEAAVKELAEVPQGCVGVIVSERVEAAVVAAAAGLEPQPTISTVRQAKGLEFDAVVVVDPAGIVAESPRGHSDLYVALTRATRRLGVIVPEALPDELTECLGNLSIPTWA